MAGPSDAFFRDIVKTVGGRLADAIPELEKRQAAARALGATPTLAEVALSLGLIDAKKLDELGALDKKPTPSAGRVKAPPPPSPSAGKLETPTAKPLHAAKPPRKRLRDRAKAVSSAALQALARPLRRGRSPEKVDRPPEKNEALPLIVAGIVVVLALLGIAIFIAVGSKKPPETPDSPPPTPVVTPVVKPGGDSPDTTPPPPRPIPDSPPTPGDGDEARREKLQLMAAAAVKRAQQADFDGAEERLGALRAAAQPDDHELVDSTERKIRILKAADALKKNRPKTPEDDSTPPEPPEPTPPPPPPRGPTPTASADVVAKLPPLLAKFDTNAARELLARAPDLVDEKAACDALDRFLALAAAGAKKCIQKEQDLRFANGRAVTATLLQVAGLELTLRISGGEQTVQMNELDRRDVCAFASLASHDDRDTYYTGRGLVFFFAGDGEQARSALKEATSPLAKKFLARIGGAPLPPPPPTGKGEKPTSAEKKPDEPPPVDANGIANLVHVSPTIEGGRVTLTYTMKNASEPRDWDAAGADRFEVCDTMRPGHWERLRCAEFGISSLLDVAVLHKVAMKGDLDYTVDFFMNACTPDKTNLVFVVGFDAQKKRWLGARFGQQLVSWDGKRMTVLAGDEPDYDSFGAAKWRSMRLERRGDKYTIFWNESERCSVTAPGFDLGRWGVVAHDLRIGIRLVEFKGVPDVAASKK